MYKPSLDYKHILEDIIRVHFSIGIAFCDYCYKPYEVRIHRIEDEDCKECVYWTRPSILKKYLDEGGMLKLLERLKEELDKEIGKLN